MTSALLSRHTAPNPSVRPMRTEGFLLHNGVRERAKNRAGVSSEERMDVREQGRCMRVLIADDDTAVRSALRLLLGQQEGVDVVGEVTSAGDLLKWLSSQTADLVLLDWHLPGQSHVDIVGTMRSVNPQLSVIALDSHPQYRPEALAMGADDFVVKGEPPEHLFDVIRNGCERTAGPLIVK